MKALIILALVIISGCSTGRSAKHVSVDNLFKGNQGATVFEMTGGRPSISTFSKTYQEIYFATPIPVYGITNQYQVEKWLPRGDITVQNTDPKLVELSELFATARRKFSDGYMGKESDWSMNLEKWYDGDPVYAEYKSKYHTVVVYSPNGKNTRKEVAIMTLEEWKSNSSNLDTN